jgi:diguanylate cyclase (GGDEF)-like protein
VTVAATASPPPIVTAAADPPRLLIVDDSRIVRATLIKHLKGSYAFREESDGEAGWNALQSDPDLQVVLTDLSMPKLDGYGLIERIRSAEDPRIRALPVVLISGEEDEAARDRAKALGATDFITKGIGTSELLARIASLVKLAKTESALSESREQQVKHPETGIFGAQYVAEQAEQILAVALRHQQSASALVIGIDGLDRIKSQYGDAVGKQIGLRFGQLLTSKIRKEDSLGHYVGDTYVVVSPATPEPGCMVFAERLRESVEALNVTLGGKRLPLTVSIGVSDAPPDPVKDGKSWLELAASRMVLASAGGGNRAVGCDDRVFEPARLPTLDHALAMLRAGRQSEIAQHAGELALLVLPLLDLANQELKLGVPMAEIEKRLLDRARKEKDARPGQ